MFSLSWRLWLQSVEGSRFPYLWLFARPVAALLPWMVIISSYVDGGMGLLLIFALCTTNSLNMLTRNCHRIEKQVRRIVEEDFTNLSLHYRLSYVLRVFMQTYLPFVLLILFLFLPSDFQSFFSWMIFIGWSGLISVFFMQAFQGSISKLFKIPDFYQASRYYASFCFVITLIAIKYLSGSDYLMDIVLGLTPIGLVTSLPLWHFGNLSSSDLLICLSFSLGFHGILSVSLKRATKKMTIDSDFLDGEVDDT